MVCAVLETQVSSACSLTGSTLHSAQRYWAGDASAYSYLPPAELAERYRETDVGSAMLTDLSKPFEKIDDGVIDPLYTDK